MVEESAREWAIYQALKAADEVAAALQAHLVEEHGGDLESGAARNTFTDSFTLLRQARERLGEGLRAVEADHIAKSVSGPQGTPRMRENPGWLPADVGASWRW